VITNRFYKEYSLNFFLDLLFAIISTDVFIRFSPTFFREDPAVRNILARPVHLSSQGPWSRIVAAVEGPS